jgi:chitinase
MLQSGKSFTVSITFVEDKLAIDLLITPYREPDGEFKYQVKMDEMTVSLISNTGYESWFQLNGILNQNSVDMIGHAIEEYISSRYDKNGDEDPHITVYGHRKAE